MVTFLLALQIVAGGDSLSAWHVPHTYCHQSAHECEARGIGMTTAAWWADPQNFSASMAPYLGPELDAVSWMLGTNDMFLGVNPIDFRASYLQVIEQTKAAAPGVPIILHTSPHINPTAQWPAAHNLVIDLYAAHVRSIVQSDPGVHLGQDFSAIPFGPFPGAHWDDFIHMSEAGHVLASTYADAEYEAHAVPEPGTVGMIACGLWLMALKRRRDGGRA